MKQGLKTKALHWLMQLIATPSPSREEGATAALIADFLQAENIEVHRQGHNVWAMTKQQPGKPVILLNSHHDTVRPVQGWQRNPFEPVLEAGALYGLGSNDAGASLVGLLATFLYATTLEHLPFQLLFLASAEEEISGAGGVSSVLPVLGAIDFGIVGEPTQMQMATAEKGLMVIDAVAKGRAGHAARAEGENAIYKAMQDIHFLKNHCFEKKSDLLGDVKISVTQIKAGTQHNVVPDVCHFVIDIRTTDCYNNQTVFDYLQQHTLSELTARSFRLNSSGIVDAHPLVQAAHTLSIPTFGSSTLSDQALMNFPTVKIGIGDSARSHTADEFIFIKELEYGIEKYIQLLETLIQNYK